MNELRAIVRHLTSPSAGESVLATLVTVEGSSYRRPGARLLLTADGSRVGSISGGCLEEDVLAHAARVRASGQAEAVIYDTTSENDLIWGAGLGCHGVVRVLVEKLPAHPPWAAALAENISARRPTTLAITHRAPQPGELGTRLVMSPVNGYGAGPAPETAAADAGVFLDTIAPPPALVIYGAGDDAQPLAALAQSLGWHVTVADVRPAFATADRFPGVTLVVAPAEQLVARTAPEPRAIAVVMTHHYVHDLPILRDLLARPLAYLGLLGPRKRAEKILGDLAAAGLTLSSAQRDRLHAPVGLDLGADSPEQVALAIIAEMQASLAGRDGRPLRQREGPIHGHAS